MNTLPRTLLITLASILSCLTSSTADSADAELTAHWGTRELWTTYHGLSSGHACDALALKVRDILLALGAHPATEVSGRNCNADRPALTVTLRVSTAVPTAGDAVSSAERELLQRSRLQISTTPFAARQSTIKLSQLRGVRLEPGDCELLEQLSRDLLPKLGMEVLERTRSCPTRPLTRPDLTVRALLPIGNAEQSTGG
jgi:hypothetical protein